MAQRDLKGKIETALARCGDQASFFRFLLNDTLEWPVPGTEQIEDISFGWSPEELQAAGIEQKLVEGPIWQIQPLEKGQPWGIFVLEFKEPDTISHRRGMAGVLRRVLRGLVASRRKDPNRPSWKHEHLLFICTYQWKHFRFAYFRSAPEDSRTPKLKTFGWSPETPNRTVCEFNLPKLVWPDVPANAEDWVAQWGQAFDKEPLTSDFFKRFDNALEKIQEDLQEYQKLPSAEAYTQAQLLLERLIFLYFLQNRGWLNQEHHFLHDKFQEYASKPDGFSYYKEFLDKLFWTLSTAPGSFGGRLPGIPFLNGGLFDDDEFAQPADLRKTNPPLKVRNATIRYVFDELLEAFNFTVTEDTPLNQDVAVDPEMLGKVFESIVLHAEQADPDAVAPDKRKATGSYYTPRIVVHFICQEVLYQYLLNHLEGDGWGPRLRALLAIDTSDGIDEGEKVLIRKTITPAQGKRVLDLVKPLRCCDPAVGSGAFPVGLLHELVNFRRVLETTANGYVDPARGEGYTWLQNTKEDIVQNCLFGVDIQQQAIEICRLRLWLSLVVDYDLGLDPFEADKTQFNRAIEGISQLPNLEMNFHRGDSLHDHISGVPVVILPEKASRHADGFQKIAKLGDELHHAKRAEKKRRLRVDILRTRLEISQRIIGDELKALGTDESTLDKLFHDETETSANKRKRIASEKEHLEQALEKITKDRSELEKLASHQYDNQFYVKLRKLEGANFDSPFNFAWRIDFPRIFALSQKDAHVGFDIIVGNPPFVNVANQTRRELYRGRWPIVCFKEYQMAAPFIECSFTLLKNDGQFGFIVSNAFAKREFGKPLVEKLLRSVDLQKIVDCSGLLFPGHGTPTCLLFAAGRPPQKNGRIRNIVILPGGGDLRTPPEESPLWHSITSHHDLHPAREKVPSSSGSLPFNKIHEDFRIAVGDCDADRMLNHPCNWCFVEWSTFDEMSPQQALPLREFLAKDVGRMLATSANDIYILQSHLIRSSGIDIADLVGITEGDEIRNWAAKEPQLLIKPYDQSWRLADLDQQPKMAQWLSSFKTVLGNRKDFGGGTYFATRRPWFEYHQLDLEKVKAQLTVAFPDVVTHAHFAPFRDHRLFKDHSPVLIPAIDTQRVPLLLAFMNSSASLFLLKQTCFNKGAGEDEHRDRFEYAGNKVQQLRVPTRIAEALNGKNNDLSESLTKYSELCLELGQRLPSLAMKKLFEKSGEAFQPWNTMVPGYVGPHPDLGKAFIDRPGLIEAFARAQAIRNQVLSEMIAIQEEMDWLMYFAYGLIPGDHPAALAEFKPGTLDREQRPFMLWVEAEGNYEKATGLVPTCWTESRKNLWKARLAAIRDNEHVRRNEQPVYKRRWDEQWKVGNQWRCGPIAYAAEFVEAFEWWLREKAEWWLEHKQNGGPVDLDVWADALLRDARVQAAWPVAAEQYAFLDTEKAREKAEENGEAAPAPAKARTDTVSFRREFKRIIEDETVPAGFPFAVPYEDLEKKLKKKVSAKLRSIRGKLNVPRERFHHHDDGMYSWAGLQFK